MARSSTAIDPSRTGPNRPGDVEPRVQWALSRGEVPSVNLAESLAVEFHVLLPAACPDVGEPALLRMQHAAREGITKRMRLAAELLLTRYGPGKIDRLAGHPSDTVRGWVCVMIGLRGDTDVAEKLASIKPFADDAHFGVREWAWMGVRRAIIDDLETALTILTLWTASHRPWLRRFAVEATRPRGVWCPHIPALKADPSPGGPLLEPLRADPEKYVQDAVANWLNDAGKTSPAWVITLTDRWLAESDSPATARIVKRARRNL